MNQRKRITKMVREFLEIEYNETVRLLEANRPLLDDIAKRLLRTTLLGREELRKIMKGHKLVVQ